MGPPRLLQWPPKPSLSLPGMRPAECHNQASSLGLQQDNSTPPAQGLACKRVSSVEQRKCARTQRNKLYTGLGATSSFPTQGCHSNWDSTVEAITTQSGHQNIVCLGPVPPQHPEVKISPHKHKSYLKTWWDYTAHFWDPPWMLP